MTSYFKSYVIDENYAMILFYYYSIAQNFMNIIQAKKNNNLILGQCD